MTVSEYEAALGPDLSRALARKGYTELTSVQQAVLEPSLDGRDLRITSQTGSGKTLAIGFAIRTLALKASPSARGIAKPHAIVVAPTRELARQVEEELTWLYAEPGRVASVTGGANYREEHRALSKGPSVIVGTPGRLLDHLERGGIDGTSVGAVVLDEADRLLDMGFRDELDAIFDKLPDERSTHLVSATFANEVRSLADRVQKNAAHVEGTRLGAVNADIAHVVHVVEARQKVDALVNLLLSDPDAQTLAFARTRRDVAEIADRLAEAGFAASSLSGEMDQAARNRALAAFKRGDLRILVATDVAARGIDVPDIARVVHIDVPTDVDTYVHRSGRTGRAGRQGTSSLLVSPSLREQTSRLLRRAGLMARFEPIPTAADIRQAIDDRAFQELTAAPPEGTPELDPRTIALAQRIVDTGDPVRVISLLLGRARGAGIEPRDVRALPAHAPAGRERGTRDRESPPPHRAAGGGRRNDGDGGGRRNDGDGGGRRNDGDGGGRRNDGDGGGRRDEGRGGGGRRGDGGGYVPFRVTWGQRQGADARRLMALICRRGDIRGSDVGAIQVESSFSIVEVGTAVAADFARAASAPDPRDPRVFIVRDDGGKHPGAHQGSGPRGPREPSREASSDDRGPRESDVDRAPRANAPTPHPKGPRSKPKHEVPEAAPRADAPTPHPKGPRSKPKHEVPEAAPRADAPTPHPKGPRSKPKHEAPERAPRPGLHPPRERSKYQTAHGTKRPHARPAPRTEGSRAAPAHGHGPPPRKKRG